MLWVNRIIALSLIGACGLLWPYTNDFPGSGSEFPRLTLIMIAVLSTVMLVRSLLPSLAAAPLLEGRPGFSKLPRPLFVFAAIGVAVFTMRYIGFFPAVAAFGAALIPILGVRRRLAFILAYAGLMTFVFVIFQLILNVPLTDRRLWGG